MTLFRPLAALLMLALAVSATAAPPPSTHYYVMRHLQKAEGQDPGLTEEGCANARKLVRIFRRVRADLPLAIYVSDTRRARATAAPLAAALRLTPRVYDNSDTPALIALVRAGPRRALIVGHSDTVPEIIARLGGTRPPPLADTDFGDVWQVSTFPGRPTLTGKIKVSTKPPFQCPRRKLAW
jgi:broad specificity phosphatase PhoE